MNLPETPGLERRLAYSQYIEEMQLVLLVEIFIKITLILMEFP
jgi:hypothetical protein